MRREQARADKERIQMRRFFALDCVCPWFKDKHSMGKKPKSQRMFQRGLFKP
jgi:hypothetical protein